MRTHLVGDLDSKSVPAQTGHNYEYFYNADEKTCYIFSTRFVRGRLFEARSRTRCVRISWIFNIVLFF